MTKGFKDIGGGGVTDHGALTGLLDDDHTQYLKETGSGLSEGVVKSDASGDLSAGALVNADVAAGAAIDWTKISKTGSNLTDLATRSHTDLSDIGSNTHATIDTHLGSTANPHSVTAAQAVAIADGADTVKDTHIDWGTGANQVSTADVPEQTNLYYTDERAQDAVGAMIDSSLIYVDETPLLQRAALTGDVTAAAGSNATTLAAGSAGALDSGNLNIARMPTGGAWSLSSDLNVDSNKLVVDNDATRVGINETSPTSTLDLSGSIAKPIVAKSSNYTLTESDYTVISSPALSLTLTLPAVADCVGRIYVIKHMTTGTTTDIATAGSETIDGDDPYILATQYDAVMIQSDGSNWHIIANKR